MTNLNKTLIQALGFIPKENSLGIFHKNYNGYTIEVDFDNEKFDFGEKIKAESKTTQNFSQAENWVVLECVDRLLEKGYQPDDITLEKVFPSGHGHSGRLDIFVEKDGKAFLMIECKTYGKEYEKELNNIHKNGGQLFTYFQNDRNAELLMLYASQLSENKITYENTIINIEQEYRETSNVKDFYERWNKLPKQNGVFEQWVKPYGFESKALTIDDLVEIKAEDSSFIFNQFLEILRHNVVSDKGNAFNRIFTLFLCKIYDEKFNEGTEKELGFQWFNAPFKYNGIEYAKDDHRTFQLRLTELYSKGMFEFLEKTVTDFSETEFKNKFPNLSDDLKDPIINEFRRVRLEKNNEFAIKDVYDAKSFEDNAVVVKEIVELLQNFKLRYTKKQQYLSDFFELLLTTGLKQESGQFFTPVPIAQYVIKSLPIDKIVEEKLANASLSNKDLLPYVMDYASGSGHFLTETMHIIQSELDKKDGKNYHQNVAKNIRRWQDDHFEWAIDYVYGIEKDYRLVKVGKVGCYLHGDGLANVIHTDGLARFGHPDYKGKLLETDSIYPKENKQFDVIVSNPPYSVSAFKNVARKYYTEDDFDIYDKLTDQSSEIECLFIERTKQLLKDGGVAGIILPSSILSNTGIYTKAREIILEYFDILGITELGSNTFMATNTSTIVLFLRRRSNYHIDSLKVSVKKVFTNLQDVTLNGIENAVSKYVDYVWEVPFADYKALLEKQPNEVITQHDIYKEYQKKIKTKKESDFWQQVLATEQEKLLYFVLTFKQQTVLIKTGQKTAEKQFLGYEFSNRRGNEGIHPIQRGKEIHECTKLFDEYCFDNPEKASTYNYRAFAENNFDAELPESLKENISYQNLVDMLTFDRVDFEKNISLNAKKKVKIESRWEQQKLVNITTLIKRGKSAKYGKSDIQIIKSGQARGFYTFDFKDRHYVAEGFTLDERKLQHGDLLLNSSGVGTAGRVTAFYLDGDFVADSHISIIRLKKDIALPKYVLNIFGMIGFKTLETLALGQSGQIEMTLDTIENIKIPLPPLDIQQKIVNEIEVLEKAEQQAIEAIKELKIKKQNHLLDLYQKGKKEIRLTDDIFDIGIGKRVLKSEVQSQGKYPIYSANVFEPFGHTDKELLTNFSQSSVVWGIDGDWMVNVIPANEAFYPTDHCGYVRITDESIEPIYLAYCLEKAGIEIGFSRTKRASIDRVSNIKIPLPPLSEQQKIVTEIEKIEEQIKALETQLAEIPQQKEQVLKKYL